MPRLSVVIPMHNRATSIERTLTSCARQTFGDWEAIVVDDASRDESCAVVRRFGDPRVRLVQRPVNGGACVARNIGALAASSDWLVFLDSDDELADDGLETVVRRSEHLPDSVGKLFFGCRWDDGSISPNPPLDGTRMNYERFLRWLETMVHRPTEAIPIVRRPCFLLSPYPSRRTPEGIHHLDFARRFDTMGFSDVIRLYHADASNREMDVGRSRQGLLDAAPAHAWMADAVLLRHGTALARYAPTVLHSYQRSGALFHLLCGERLLGARLAFQAWTRQPRDLRALAVLVGSLAPARLLATLKTTWLRRRTVFAVRRRLERTR